MLLNIFKPLVSASDSLPAVIGILLVVHILWFAGLHGVNVVVAIINPIILTNLATNQAALQAGEKATKVLAGGFLDAFVYLGGAGATLGLAIAMFLSKKDHIKSIGKISLIPGLFNINEPIIFGFPVVFNPIMAIPFILAPVISVIMVYTSIATGIVEPFRAISVPWTTPFIISGFLIGGVKAAILQIAVFSMTVAVYFPFFKYQDKLAYQEEQKIGTEATV